MKFYFKKINTRNPVPFNGAAIRFQAVAGHDGVIELDDSNQADMIAELERLAGARKLGVVRISAEIFESLKKKPPSPPSLNQPVGLRQQVRLAPEKPSLVKPNPPVLVVPRVVASPSPVPPPAASIPTAPGKPIASPIQFKPKRGKLSSLEKGNKAGE